MVEQDQQAFLQAIRDDPSDIAARLVYADWLDERSDRKGELIRIQCELCQTDSDDSRYQELREREQELLPGMESSPECDRVLIWTLRRQYESLQHAIMAGMYDYINGSITAEHFKLEGEIVVDTDALLYHPNCDIASDDVVKKLDHIGLRPATLPELLTFGEQYPDIQRQFPIVALGSLWVNLYGSRGAPYLGDWNAERELRLHWWDIEWDPNYRFLAAHKQLTL